MHADNYNVQCIIVCHCDHLQHNCNLQCLARSISTSPADGFLWNNFTQLITLILQHLKENRLISIININ